ncbi:MAG TPA: exodeoxyribonuclease VII large subunit [Gammaproteobacteria bacterium]|nr:exodeoxyribonuclease VII large subunit [Gammaproteobacteria bacterium]
MVRMATARPDQASAAPAGRALVYSVSQLNREVRDLLDHGFPALWVEGELSNLKRPSSGHWYFSLKDERAAVRCAMFRQRNMLLRFRPEEGLKVLVRGRVNLYEPRGEYQFVVEHMEPSGEGALRQQFEALKARLQAEGLFAAERKRPLPAFPRCIGVVTSPSGAAIRDVLHVLRRRYPPAEVIVYPVQVQGEQAPGQILRAIRTAGERAECDVLIVTRGGGSLEDLWAFNDEGVARAIAACPVPVVSGVGHEVDFSIADFVADRRAPTPSAAAELVAPDAAELVQGFQRLAQRLQRAQQLRLQRSRDHLRSVTRRLDQCHPGRRLGERMQRLDELEQRLRRAAVLAVETRRGRLQTLRARLRARTPGYRLDGLRQRLEHLAARLARAQGTRLDRQRQQLEQASRALHTVSPLATLERGYAVARRIPDGTVLRRADMAAAGDAVSVRLARGELLCEVRESHPDSGEDG